MAGRTANYHEVQNQIKLMIKVQIAANFILWLTPATPVRV